MTGRITYRRIYDEPDPSDGTRVLVDRVWPRGLTRAAARLDEWLRDVAPSTELRRWYHHDPALFTEFRDRYLAELAEPDRRAAADHLRAVAAEGDLTLLTATKDVDRSQAAVLAAWLSGRSIGPG